MSTEPDATGPDRDEVAALRREVDQLRERLDELEAKVGPSDSTLSPAASDYRDARVFEALSPGERVRVSTLYELYDERTDIRDRDVRRSRVKDLVESAAFTRTDDRVWRFRDVATDGGDSDG